MSGLPAPHEVVETALAAASTAGCVVLVEDSSQAEVRFAVNMTTTNGVRTSRRVTVISLVEVGGGVAAGVASRAGAVDVGELVRVAEAAAAGGPPAEDASPLVGSSAASDFDVAPAVTDLSILAPVLAELAGAFERAERTDTVLSGFADHVVATTYVGTSAGARRRFVQPTGTCQLVGRAGGGARSAWVGVGTTDFRDVAFESLEAELSRRLGWAQRTVELDAGRYETILPASAVADLMLYLAGTASGKDAEDGRTVFSKPGGGTRVGDRLSDLAFVLRSDPAAPGLECAPFVTATASDGDSSVFDNGLDRGATTWIDAGRLERLVYHRAGARRSGVEVSPPIDNLVLELPGATGSVGDLVARTERGLLLTCLWYIRVVDPSTLLLTGLTRDGVYLVEDGEVTASVNNFRFNESPVDLLGRVSEAGATERTFGREFGEDASRTAMPPLRIPDFNMSSVSPAN